MRQESYVHLRGTQYPTYVLSLEEVMFDSTSIDACSAALLQLFYYFVLRVVWW
jgi:hypothetical protein